MDRPVLIAAEGPAGSLGVDGLPRGCAALWSHWPHAPEPPPELADDTATGMALKAAEDPDRWLSAFPLVVDDHADVDGLLALATCADPRTARRHRTLLRDAAECSDFTCWINAPALRLVLLINRRLAHCHDDHARTQVATAIAKDLEGLCAAAFQGDCELDAPVSMVESSLDRLHSGQGVTTALAGDTLVIRWNGTDRGTDPFAATTVDTAYSPFALSAFAPNRAQLLVVEDPNGGHRLWLDAPRHAWARTVRRTPWPMRDLSAAANLLTATDPDGRTWLAGDAAKAHGFTCLLACPQPTRWESAAILTLI